MGRNSYFTFKQFTVHQEHSAMKVGVDSVLLGAWVNLENNRTILDVGAGTGLLALMIAQRCAARISAVELDEPAYRDALSNIAASPWPNRIELEHTAFQSFALVTEKLFDHIVANPPYFINSSRPQDMQRKNARHNDQLSLEDLLSGCSRILSDAGKVSIILPVETATQTILLANHYGLYLNRTAWIRHTPEKPWHRRLLEFSRLKEPYLEVFLTIQSAHEYTPEYRNLTRDFYLAF